MKVIESRKVEDVVIELFDDYSETLEEFSNNYNKELLEFAETICKCHRNFQLFNSIRNPSDRVIQAGGFVYLSFDNTYTSMKLLMLGYLTSLDVESFEKLLPQYREEALNSDFYLTLDAILLRFLHSIRVVSASDVMDEAKSCLGFWTTR